MMYDVSDQTQNSGVRPTVWCAHGQTTLGIRNGLRARAQCNAATRCELNDWIVAKWSIIVSSQFYIFFKLFFFVVIFLFDQHQMIYLFDRNTENRVVFTVVFAFFFVKFLFIDQLLNIPRKPQLRKTDAPMPRAQFCEHLSAETIFGPYKNKLYYHPASPNLIN